MNLIILCVFFKVKMINAEECKSHSYIHFSFSQSHVTSVVTTTQYNKTAKDRKLLSSLQSFGKYEAGVSAEYFEN